MDADLWLNDVKVMLESLQCSDHEKLGGAVSLLRGSARVWWTNTTMYASPEQVNWQFFLDEFKNKYIGEQFMRSMLLKFLNLKQGDRTVHEYEAEYNKLIRYATEVINRAKVIERAQEVMLAIYQSISMGKRIGTSLFAQYTKRDKGSGSQFTNRTDYSAASRKTKQSHSYAVSSGGAHREKSLCQTCGKSDGGACKLLSGTCFNCGGYGHFAQNCPKKYGD
ncbi:uncharacterized protein LOC120168034 [Hibiscus syriacus]|uniref:uncharacterized protein LOC120168034 n=1 Tax=Hibiscus syriacus TaxID=106335 RepID=UPI0019225D79|nr:uncharacterized protein LOC120168034 [Hibiscus syriacus]